MKQVGKIGRINQKANVEIAKMFAEKDINYCEVCTVLAKLGYLKEPCLQATSNAHRHGRVWYRKRPELLWDFKQVVKACIPSHTFIDRNSAIREEVFTILRGKE
jgi:hypothetical protein